MRSVVASIVVLLLLAIGAVAPSPPTQDAAFTEGIPLLARLCSNHLMGNYTLLRSLDEYSPIQFMLEQYIDCIDAVDPKQCRKMRDTWNDFTVSFQHLVRSRASVDDLVKVNAISERPYLATRSSIVDVLYMNVTFGSDQHPEIEPITGSLNCIFSWNRQNRTQLMGLGIRNSLYLIRSLIPEAYIPSMQLWCKSAISLCGEHLFDNSTTKCVDFLHHFRAVDYDGIPRRSGDSLTCRRYWFNNEQLSTEERCAVLTTSGQDNVHCHDDDPVVTEDHSIKRQSAETPNHPDFPRRPSLSSRAV